MGDPPQGAQAGPWARDQHRVCPDGEDPGYRKAPPASTTREPLKAGVISATQILEQTRTRSAQATPLENTAEYPSRRTTAWTEQPGRDPAGNMAGLRKQPQLTVGGLRDGTLQNTSLCVPPTGRQSVWLRVTSLRWRPKRFQSNRSRRRDTGARGPIRARRPGRLTHPQRRTKPALERRPGLLHPATGDANSFL